ATHTLSLHDALPICGAAESCYAPRSDTNFDACRRRRVVATSRLAPTTTNERSVPRLPAYRPWGAARQPRWGWMAGAAPCQRPTRSEEHTSELQSLAY